MATLFELIQSLPAGGVVEGSHTRAPLTPSQFPPLCSRTQRAPCRPSIHLRNTCSLSPMLGTLCCEMAARLLLAPQSYPVARRHLAQRDIVAATEKDCIVAMAQPQKSLERTTTGVLVAPAVLSNWKALQQIV